MLAARIVEVLARRKDFYTLYASTTGHLQKAWVKTLIHK